VAGYHGLDRENVHHVTDHAETYVKGNVYTNGIENFWSLLKRGLKGTYFSVEPFQLFRSLDEQTCRFNNQKTDDSERFVGVMSGISRKRVTYDKLTGKEKSVAAPA
jgi:hypothetical protein